MVASTLMVAGFGFRDSANLTSFQNAFAKAAKGYDIAAMAVPEDKINHPELQKFARALAIPLYGVENSTLQATITPTQSDIILQKRQTGSIAEAAAIAIFTSTAIIAKKRCISDDRLAVCAVAEGDKI